MDLFTEYPIYYKEINTIQSRGSGNRMTILRLDAPNSGLFLNGWANGDKILINSCYEFNGWNDVTGLEEIKDHYENGADWIESEIVDKGYFDLAVESLVQRDCKIVKKEEAA